MARPRSEKAHQKVLEAAVGLFAREGIDSTSMDAIAASSGVSKATIYKHWPDKDALALEVLVWLYRLDEDPPVNQHENVREDLIAAMLYRPAEHHSKERERIMPHLIAYSARNIIFGKAWRSKVLSRHSAVLAQVLQSSIERGELRPDLKIDFAIALLFGPMMYRQIFVAQSRDEKPPRDYVEHVVDAFLLAYAKDPYLASASQAAESRRAH